MSRKNWVDGVKRLELGGLGETPGTQSLIFQVEQVSGVDSPETEKDLDVIDKHEVEEQGEESPKIEVNQEFGKDQDVEETLEEKDTEDRNQATVKRNIQKPGNFCRIQILLLMKSVEHWILCNLVA